MTDREKLDALARQRMAEREAATAERQRERTGSSGEGGSRASRTGRTGA